MASFKRVTPPAAEPVAVEDLRAFLRVAHEEDDAAIARLGRAARERVEEETGLALMPQSWRMAADFAEARMRGAWRVFALRRPPFVSLTEVRIVREDDTSAALSMGDVRVRRDSAEVLLPATHAAYAAARAWRPVEIVWQSGYADADAVPEALKTAIMLMVAQGWERRDSVAAPLSAAPEAVAGLIAPFREMRL